MKLHWPQVFCALASMILLMGLGGCTSAGPKALAQCGSNDLVAVLYVPGLLDDGKEIAQWRELNELFRCEGFELKVPERPSKGTRKAGAKELFSEAQRLYGSGRFHIVAKSMGGLWVRQLLHDHPDFARRVISVTTISTPHHGSEVADELMGSGDDKWKIGAKGPEDLFLTNVFGVDIDKFFDELKSSGKDLTKERLRQFNVETHSDPYVRYFSFGYRIGSPEIIKVFPWSLYGHHIIKIRGGGDNDGLVSTSSAEWGEYIETAEGEHFAETSRYVPYAGRFIWRDVFLHVIRNLQKWNLK